MIASAAAGAEECEIIMSEKKSNPARLGEQKSPDMKNVKYNDYTRTLLAEGIRIGALKNSDAEKLSSALLAVLTDLLADYLRREGITDELEYGATAAELMQSLIFTIDTYLISLSDTALALKKLKGVKEENVREMREGGIAALRVLQCEALSLHVKAKKLVPPVKATVMRDALRSCHSIILTYDREYMSAALTSEPCYPLAVPFGLSGGIKYIRRYLRQLTDENRFCKDVGTAVMRRFGKLLYEQRAEEDGRFCQNIYIPTLVSATICAYLKKETKELILTPDDCELFCRLTKSFSDTQLGELLEDVVSKLPAGNREYNLQAISRIMPEFITSTRAKTLDKLALVQRCEPVDE